MDTQPTGTLPGEGQPQQGNPQPAGQPQVTPPQQPNSGEQPKSQDNPQLAELQQKLAQFEAQAKKNEESARFYQSNYDRAQQQLRALAGVQPQADPLEEKVKAFAAKGYNPDDVRGILGIVQAEINPLIQQNQMLQQTIQATSVVGDVLQSAASDPRYAALFYDPDVQRQVQQAVQHAALSGQRDLVNPQYALECAKLAWADKQLSGQAQQHQAQPQAQPMPNFTPFLGPQPGFKPAPAPAKQSNPLADQLSAQMAAYTGIPINQQ